MPDGNQGDNVVLNRSHQAQDASEKDQYHSVSTAGSARRTSSSVSSRSQRRSPSPSRAGSRTPLTPEESPPSSRSTRKRNASIVEEEDKELEGSRGTLAHTGQSSGDSGIHVCICQPDPKIPRPRNAFILYRQHYQANVVAQNPGLANPEISKIIGEQWQNQPPEVKNKWKALAEEEKIRHQQQYPTYRYQPKRSGRRGSLSSESTSEKAKCTKCGGRSILTPSTPYHPQPSSNLSPASGPHTPSSTMTPVSRTLPVLKDLSLQSPGPRRSADHEGSNMPLGHNGHPIERDEFAPLSPDAKRRRFNGDHQPTLSRVMAPRYAPATPGVAPVGPGTPFPFGQPPPPPHPYPPAAAAAHARRESLPGLRGMVSPPGPMAPPPRPGPGYQQHRLSQGHSAHDRSLTLPPLQTGGTGAVAGAVVTAAAGKTTKEQIMNMDFRHKIHVLRRVAPPSPVKKDSPRGPFVVIEGDNFEAVKDLGLWLSDTLRKGDDLKVDLLQGPTFSGEGEKEELMAQSHQLAAEWLIKTREIKASLAMSASSPGDSVMVDAASKPSANRREVDEKYDESDDSFSHNNTTAIATTATATDTATNRRSSDRSSDTNMDNPPATTISTTTTSSSSSSPPSSPPTRCKPVSIIANYSLHASNFFACRVPIDAHDPYAPSDHWQWTATQWRGIMPPDLTIYVRDVSGAGGRASLEILDEGKLFVVRRTRAEAGREGSAEMMEPSTLRRLGFEVSEWVRAFGGGE